ncbi:MAG: DUF4395 domain-containing protein [Acidimicrobiia bacterium]
MKPDLFASILAVFTFPNPVNEVSARLVATGVVLMCAATLAFQAPWIIVVLAYGFVARVLTGPTLSPLGQFVTRVLTPALPFAEKLTPGPPKRFAQGIGATLSVGALVAWVGFGNTTVAFVLVAMILVAASLEAFLGFCLGCKIFAVLMRVGLIPEHTCVECNDIWSRLPAPAETASR